MKTVTYYAGEIFGTGSKPRLRGLFRRVDGDQTLLLQKWTGEKWTDWPDLLRATGYGGNAEYVEISKAKAERIGGAKSVADAFPRKTKESGLSPNLHTDKAVAAQADG